MFWRALRVSLREVQRAPRLARDHSAMWVSNEPATGM